MANASAVPPHTQMLGMSRWLRPLHFAGSIDCGVRVRALEYGESALCRGFVACSYCGPANRTWRTCEPEPGEAANPNLRTCEPEPGEPEPVNRNP